MCDRWLLLSLILCVWISTVITTTSLIQRIRENQNTEGKSRGLDLTPDSWIHVPQALQDVLASIDDRLRGLDTFGYTLKLARLDFSLEQLVRRLENIETKLGRLETKFDLRMEKVEEVVIGKDIKEEFSNEHLSRRMEHLNDKLNNKASFLDAKIDIRMERITNKLELLERDLHNSVDDILEKLVKSDERHSQFENAVIGKFLKIDDVVLSFNDLRLFLKEELVNLIQKRMDTLDLKVEETAERSIQQTEEQILKINRNLSQTNDQMKRFINDAQSTLSNISSNCNIFTRIQSLAPICEKTNYTTDHFQQQLDTVISLVQKSIKMEEIKFKELDTDVEIYTKKMVSNIQELWKNSEEHKSILFKVLESGNKSQDMIRNELNKRLEQNACCDTKLSKIGENIDKKISELKSTVDTSFATLLVAQNTFISTCKRIQQEETHVYDILQQVVHEMRNRSITDVSKISIEIQQNEQMLSISLDKILNAIFLLGNNTANEIEKYANKCVIRRNSWKSFIHHSADVSDQIVLNKTQVTNGDNTNKFQELTNDTEQLDRTSENNNTFVNDYDIDYPSAESDYNERLQD